MSLDSRLPAFRNLSPAARLDHIGQLLGLSHDDVSLLANAGALPMDIANGMIENVIGKFELPHFFGDRNIRIHAIHRSAHSGAELGIGLQLGKVKFHILRLRPFQRPFGIWNDQANNVRPLVP